MPKDFSPGFNIKQFFPFFSGENKELVFLDNAATTHKPQPVLEEIANFYTNYNSNTGRSSHSLASQADA